MTADAVDGSGVSRDTVLVGLIGAGIQPSRTPAMHEREGAEQGLTYIYKKIDLEVLGLGPDALPELLTAAERMGFAGVNVTYPCKQSVIPLLHELSPDAAALGAVNTVIFREGRRIGHNTDWWGFAESFRHELPDARRKQVVQFGAGGAGAAVAHAALTRRRRAAHSNRCRTAARGPSRPRAVRAASGRSVQLRATIPLPQLPLADGLINATPVGMAKYPGMPVAAEALRPDLWVADIVYFPLETELLRAARSRGCRTMSGAGMAVFQAAAAFRLFSGREANAERMLRHFETM